jgi:KUP system potassium uptake protein
MVVWFSTLAVLGLANIIQLEPDIFKAISPTYSINFLMNYPGAFWLLGSVFLCTTGAEALYSDMGHCGRQNIQISWIFVKICLILNYLGQGAWLLSVKAISADPYLHGTTPFYGSMPEWFLIPGIIIATMATIIASQALISGSYTLISEAIRLNLWPKVKLLYPTLQRGQLYIPSINWLLCFGCIGVVLYFKKSSAMEGAYGLAITLTMMVTTVLLSIYLRSKKVNKIVVYFVLVFFLIIELSFLVANLEKLPHGGFVTVVISMVLILAMSIWFSARKIKNRFTEFEALDKYLPIINELSNDESVPKYAILNLM